MGKRGPKGFQPTKTQRDAVTLLCGLHMNHEQLCELIIDPITRQPISRQILERAFAKELAGGNAQLKAMIATKLVQCLNSPEPNVVWRSTEWALKHLWGFKDDGTQIGVAINNGKDDGLRIGFVWPNGKQELDLDEITANWDAPQPDRPLIPHRLNADGSNDTRRPQRLKPVEDAAGRQSSPSRARDTFVNDEPVSAFSDRKKSWMD